MFPVKKFDRYAQPAPKQKKPVLKIVPGGLPSELQLFTCKRQAGNLKLTPGACAGLFKRALKANLTDHPHMAYCRTCTVGKQHSGMEIVPLLPKTCIRCERKGLRRLDAKLLCISCGNRQREVIAGRNAKGVAPVRFIPLRIFDYADSLICVGRDSAEALRVVSAITGVDSLKPETLIDYGLATRFEIGHWWKFIVLPWSSKHTRISSVQL